MNRYLFWLVMTLMVICPGHSRAADLLVDALLARVGREPILYSDILRFKDVEAIVACSDGKEYVKQKDTEQLLPLLTRYIEGEFVYQELKTKKSNPTRTLRSVIDLVMKNPGCRRRWQELGERYSKLWSTPAKPKEGGALLVKEFEKRLAIHEGTASVIQGDRESWLRGARVRMPIKLFLE